MQCLSLNQMAEFSHYSVMLDECIKALNINPCGIYVDCTLGGGGHSEAILKKLTNGKLIAIDQDIEAIEHCKIRLQEYENKIIFVNENFANLDNILNDLSIDKIDGIIYDLGVSSYQLDTAERGFSYSKNARLDMRMSQNAPLSAYDVVNTYSESELRRIIFEYGEEPNAKRIAQAICTYRNDKEIETTFELTEIIKSVTPNKKLFEGHHPAKQTFQAIRIEVNGELSILSPAIETAVNRLNVGGRIVIITFHSLEDRAVKQVFARLEKGCTCPPSFPICVCGKKPSLYIEHKKPILPSDKELLENHRSHSAKMRYAEKISC